MRRCGKSGADAFFAGADGMGATRGAQVKALRWQGSGDIGALSKANCFLVVPVERQDIAAGEIVSVLPRWDVLWERRRGNMELKELTQGTEIAQSFERSDPRAQP